jgi:hypothetical protein
VARPALIPLLAVSAFAIWTTGASALQLLILEPVYPGVALAAGAIGILAVAVAIVLRRPRIVTCAELALVFIYVLVLVARPAASLASATAPIIAGGVFLSAQLGWWAIELRTPAHEATAALLNRAGLIGARSLGAAILGELIWQASRVHPGSGVAFLAIGLLAMIGVAAVYLRVTARQAVTPPFAMAAESSLQSGPRSHRSRGKPRSIRQLLLSAVRPPDFYPAWRSRRSMKTQSLVAILLLLIDLVFTLGAIGSSVHPQTIDGVRTFVSTGNAARGIAFGIIGAGAIILGWIALYLRSSISPSSSATGRPSENSSRAVTLTDLETIRMMCRRLWRSGHPDLDLNQYLDAMGGELAGSYPESVSTDRPAPASVAQVESLLAKLESVADG